MKCPECNNEEMEKGTIDKYPFPSSGLELELLDWPVWRCACGAVMPEIANPERLKIYITKRLILQERPLDGDSILFLRKRMGRTGVKLAESLGVSRVEISRWENDTNDISPYMDFKLRIEAIEQLVPGEYQSQMKLAVVNVMHSLYKPELVEPTPIEVPAAAVAAAGGAFAFA